MVLGSEARLSKAEARQPASAHFFRRRDFEGRERELMEEASSSDASRSQKQRGARSSKSTHTHTRARITTPHSRASPRPSFPPRPSLCLSLYCLHLPLLFHSPSPCQSHAPAAHRHPCAVRAISAASGHSNKHKQRNAARPSLRVSAPPSPANVSLASACLC